MGLTSCAELSLPASGLFQAFTARVTERRRPASRRASCRASARRLDFAEMRSLRETTTGDEHADSRGGARGVRSATRGPGGRARRAGGGRGARAPRGLRRLPHRSLHGFRRGPLGLCPDGARARGRGHRRAGRRRRRAGRARRSRRNAVLTPVRRVRPLPQPQDQSLPGDSRAAESRLSPRWDHPPFARRRADPPLHGDLDLRRVRGAAADRAGEGLARRRRSTGPACSRAASRPASARRCSRPGRARLDVRRVRGGHGRPRRRGGLPAPGRRADRLRRPLRGPARACPRAGRDGRPRRRTRGRWTGSWR